MIPNTPYSTTSRQEKRVFDKLQAASFNKQGGVYTAYHSLNIPRHARKRWAEIDFLICGPKGIFALEVKGGKNVSCQNGLWSYGRGTSYEGPFRQVESGLHGLRETLKKNFPDYVTSQFSYGYGVIVPECQLPPSSEWDPHTVVDIRGFNDLEKWLWKLFQYWREKDGGNRKPDSVSLEKIRRYLRPEFEAVVPLHGQTHDIRERVAKLTEDQMVMVDVVAANPRVLCSGGAGTGKTFLAMELARRWTAEGMNVLLSCRSPYLKSFLESRFTIPKLTVSLVDAIRVACNRKGLEYFDALIVDEGQDIFDLASLDRLDSVIKNGLADGRWCIFHDINNQSGLLSTPDQEAIEYLGSLQPAQVPLHTNCRNTRVILEKVQTSLGADMGTKGVGEGPKIREHKTTSRDEAAKFLTKEISALVGHGRLAPGDVTILSPCRFEDSCLVDLPERIAKDITALDEYSSRSLPGKRVTFAKVSDFKGLENDAIILTDLPPPQLNDDLAVYYVGMSRARSVLSLIYYDV